LTRPRSGRWGLVQTKEAPARSRMRLGTPRARLRPRSRGAGRSTAFQEVAGGVQRCVAGARRSPKRERNSRHLRWQERPPPRNPLAGTPAHPKPDASNSRAPNVPSLALTDEGFRAVRRSASAATGRRPYINARRRTFPTIHPTNRAPDIGSKGVPGAGYALIIFACSISCTCAE
jgi:hypothetical protein